MRKNASAICAKLLLLKMEVDKSNLRGIIINSVKQLDSDLEFFNQLEIKRRPFDKIMLCGMGGSALVGDILEYFKMHDYSPLIANLPIQIHRNYDLLSGIEEKTLIICSSYSGDTEETLSAYNRAKQEGLEIAALTSGGKLAEFCRRDKTPWIKIPTTLQPRLSLGYQLSAVVKIFMAYGLLAAASGNALTDLSKKIIPSQLELEAKTFCPKLSHKIPIIYASDKNYALARIWKIKFNENTKIPAFWNVFPELNHNEMVGWTNTFGPFHFFFLQDDTDLPQIHKRMKLTAELLKQRDFSVDLIRLSGADVLEKLFWGMVFGDWISYHLALFYGTDPNPVEMVEEFKKKLSF